MISLDAAREIARDEWFPVFEKRSGRAFRIADADTEEYDWGWAFYCESIPAPSGPPPSGHEECEVVLVERFEGRSIISNPAPVHIIINGKRLAGLLPW